MIQQHPITPPPELIQRWSEQFEEGRSLYAMFEDIYRAGADAELEACCEWLDLEGWSGESRQLCAARRPKAPSLKEQALDALAHIATGPNPTAFLECQDTIRRALEQLPDHE
jgi:hypothetical protein